MNFCIDNQTLSFELFNEDNFMVQSVPKPYSVSWDTTSNPCESINAILAQNPNNILLIDEHVWSLYGKEIRCNAENLFKAPATESFKQLEGVMQLYDYLHQRQFTKGETLVVVGGGIIQDIGAYVGATYKRGIRWVYFPTTLLAMSDSCIGGKAGVNYQGAKNQLALFSSPSSVIINSAFLKTLEKKEIQSGLGEILKLFITGGMELLEQYPYYLNQVSIGHHDYFKPLILGALAVKKAVIERDEFEQNIRKGLNYGHTLGHVIESISHYAIPHGIAVVVGMMLMNEMNCILGNLSRQTSSEINQLGLSLLNEELLDLLQRLDLSQLTVRVRQDKKVIGNNITLIMLNAPGKLDFVSTKIDESFSNAITQSFQHLFYESVTLS